MILEKIEIESFGKFKDFTLNFEKGVNVLYGMNESGKSTICAFLYAMFYDFPSSKQKYTLREDLRKRYMPWSGGDMSGTVHFIHDGKKYVLKRRMGKTPRSTKVSLHDGETWEEIKDERKENPGEYFLGIGEDGFLKTIYISQLGAVIERGKNDEIIERLSNLRQSGDEDISYQKTVDILTKQKHSLISVGGGAGKIVKLRAEKEALSDKLCEALRLEEAYKNAHIKKTEEEKNRQELLDAKNALLQKKLLAEQFKKYQQTKEAEKRLAEIESEKEKLSVELEKSDEKLSATTERKEELEFLSDLEESAPQILSELDARNVISEQRLHAIGERKEEAKKLEEELNDLKASKKRKINILLLIAAGFLFAAGASLALFVLPWLALIIIPAVFLGAASFMPSKSEKELEEKIIALSAEIERIKPDSEEENKILTEQKHNREKAEEILKRAHCHSLSELLKKLSERDTINELIRAGEKENALIKENIKRLSSEAEKLAAMAEKTEFSEEIINYSGGNTEEIEEKLQNIQNETVLCEKKLTEAETTLSALSGSEKSSSEIRRELEINEQETAELQKIYDATEKALSMIEESYEDLKSDFAPLLSEKVRHAASFLTGGKYTDVRISDDYGLKVQSEGDIIDADYVSGGTYDVLYLALRLGILKILFDDKIPFLILDDTFLQFDDVRASQAAGYIKNEGISQVLYFTCHKEQRELFGKDNVNIINF